MIPIVIINGPLGSGKTTLIHSLLTNCIDSKNTLWVKTEFGDYSIDEYLLQDTKVQTKNLTGGCICHVLLSKFGDLLSQIESEKSIDRVIVETSGMSHPEPVIQIIERHPYFNVAHITLVVDAEHAGEVNYPKPMKGVALPYDVIIFNKYPDKLTNTEEADLDKKLDPWFDENCKDIKKINYYNKDSDLEAYQKSINKWCAMILENVQEALVRKPHILEHFNNHKHEDHDHEHEHEDHEGHIDVLVFHFAKDQKITKDIIEAYTEKLPSEVVRIKGIFKTDDKWEFFNWARGSGSWQSLPQPANAQLLLVMGHGISNRKDLQSIQ